MNGEKKKSQRKAFGARRRGGIRGGRLRHRLETGGVQEALEHPHWQQLRETKCHGPIKGGRGCTSTLSPAPIILHLALCKGREHSWAPPRAGLGTGSGLGFAHVSNSLPRPWSALFSKSRHVSFQVADMERKTHTKTNHLVLPSPDGEQPAPTCHWGLRWTRSQSDKGDGVRWRRNLPSHFSLENPFLRMADPTKSSPWPLLCASSC